MTLEYRKVRGFNIKLFLIDVVLGVAVLAQSNFYLVLQYL